MLYTYGFGEFAGYLQGAERRFQGALADGLRDSAAIVERRAKTNVQRGRPEWAPLAPATRAARMRKSPSARAGERQGKRGVTPLYDEGTMLRSISHEVEDQDLVAVVGSSVGYAAVHELGTSRAGKGRSNTIPARPFLQPAAEEGLEECKGAMRERVRRAVEFGSTR